MAKQRIIDTRYWDDKYIRSLQPHGKLLFVYLFTNALTTIAGAYEIATDRMTFDTGIPEIEILSWLEKFEADGKMCYRDGWLLVINTIKHQTTTNAKIRTGIEIVVNGCPGWVKDRLSIAYQWLSHLNLNSNPNSDSNDGRSRPSQPAAPAVTNTPDPTRAAWDDGVALLAQSGLNEQQSRPLLGRLAREFGKDLLIESIAATRNENPADPKTFLLGVLRHRSQPSPAALVGRSFTATDDPLIDGTLPWPSPELKPREVAHEQRLCWQAVRDKLRPTINPDTWKTWFSPAVLAFDGFNEDSTAFRLRAHQATHDWLRLYYADAIEKAMKETGFGDYRIEWTVEDASYQEAA